MIPCTCHVLRVPGTRIVLIHIGITYHSALPQEAPTPDDGIDIDCSLNFRVPVSALVPLAICSALLRISTANGSILAREKKEANGADQENVHPHPIQSASLPWPPAGSGAPFLIR